MSGKVFLALAILLGVFSEFSCDDDWWKHMQLYQIYPRSFKDSNGDGIGDIKGIIEKLPHLKNIGVDATWLSPIFPSPMKDFGYDISNYYDIAEEYGTIADLEELIAEAKKLDIRILLDFVPNHTSDQCEWFKKSVQRDLEYQDYYIWHDGLEGGTKPPSNWNSVFRGSAWTYNEERGQWYLHQFLKEQPDLNFRNYKVIAEMKNVLNFWLEKGVAGFRVDAIPHLIESEVDADGNYIDEPLSGNTDPESYDYLIHTQTRERSETYDAVFGWRETLDAVSKSETNTIGTRVLLMEAMSSTDLVIQYYGNGTREGAHFPFNFNLAFLDKDANAIKLRDDIESWLDAVPDGRVTNWVVGNHDQPRVASRFGADLSDGIIMLGMLLPGVAVTYNGEEIGMENFYLSWEDTVDPQGCNAGIDLFNSTSRDPARTPFQWDNTPFAGFSTKDPWLPVATNYETLNLQKQINDETSPYKLYVSLSELRKNEVIKNGDIEIKAITNDIFAFSRYLPDQDPIITVINTRAAARLVDVNSHFKDLRNGVKILAASRSSTRKTNDQLSTSFTLNAYESLVLTSGVNGLLVSQFLVVMIALRSLFKLL